MDTVTTYENGESASPPLAEHFHSHTKTKPHESALGAPRDSTVEPVVTPLSMERDDTEDAKLVDIAFLIDSADRQREVLEVLRHKLYIIGDRVREKHPDVSIRVAFIGYCSYPVVADLKKLGDGIFQEAVSVVLRRDNGRPAGRSVFEGLEEVPHVGWSASHRLLVQVSDARMTSSQGESEGNGGDTGSSSGRALRSSPCWTPRRIALLQRLRTDYGLQKYYFAHFNASTRQLIQELQHSCGAGAVAGDGDELPPSWLVSEQLHEPGVLPHKVAELVLGLLNRPNSSTGASFQDGGARSSSRGSASSGQGYKEPPADMQSPANHKVTSPGDIGGVQGALHSYSPSSTDDGVHTGGRRSSPQPQPSVPPTAQLLLMQPGSHDTDGSGVAGGGVAGEGGGSTVGSTKCVSPSDVGSGASVTKSGQSQGTISSRGSTKSSPLVITRGAACQPKHTLQPDGTFNVGDLTGTLSTDPRSHGGGEYGGSFVLKAGQPAPPPPIAVDGTDAHPLLPPPLPLLKEVSRSPKGLSEAGSTGKASPTTRPPSSCESGSSKATATATAAATTIVNATDTRDGANGGDSCSPRSQRLASEAAGSMGSQHQSRSLSAASSSHTPSQEHSSGLEASGATTRRSSMVPSENVSEQMPVMVAMVTAVAAAVATAAKSSSLPSEASGTAGALMSPTSAASVAAVSSSCRTSTQGTALSDAADSGRDSSPRSVGPRLSEAISEHTITSNKSSFPQQSFIAGDDATAPVTPLTTGPPSEASSVVTPFPIRNLKVILPAATSVSDFPVPSAYSSRASPVADQQRLSMSVATMNVRQQPPVLHLRLPWSARALEDFKSEMRKTPFVLMSPSDEPRTARMDAVFAMPPELWPVLPPGALYCLEALDPRFSFQYLQHRSFPTTKVRVNTYFGKWGRHLVDYVVSWQPIPRGEAAWQLTEGKQPPLPWEQRQVVAQTTHGEYQYANTRMKFQGPKSLKPDAEMVEYSDAHGVDLMDTKAANETAPRNSDKDREAHLIDPPRPNTWGELARRPLISNLRSRGGGAYVHHVNYDHSSLRTSCGRRVPAGYFFTLVPNATFKAPAVPGGGSRSRPSSAGRAITAARQSRSLSSSTPNAAAAAAATAALTVSSSVLSRVQSTALHDLAEESSAAAAAAATAALTGKGRPGRSSPSRRSLSSSMGCAGAAATISAAVAAAAAVPGLPMHPLSPTSPSMSPSLTRAELGTNRLSPPRAASPTVVGVNVVTLASKDRWRTYDVPFNHPINSTRAQALGNDAAKASGRGVRYFSDTTAVMKVAEEEMRLQQPFVPGPVVVRRWNDIPRLYAEHMEAARALMPVTELDNYGTSKLHMLIHHLQCAATLEYDRLDAKLMLLPQMARLGRKSAEIDAWLQATIEHASYLYDKLQIYDKSIWTSEPSDAATSATAAVAAVRAPQTGSESPSLLRTSMVALPQPSPPVVVAAAATAPGKTQGWVFPDPLKGTVHASLSAVNATAQPRPAVWQQQVPVQQITKAEWSAVVGIMNPTRHAMLYEVWSRLRPIMTGATQVNGSSCAASRAGSAVGAASDACATFSGEGDAKSTTVAGAAGLPDMFCHGSVNREVLDYLHRDLEAMSSPDFTPQPLPSSKILKQRGYRGEGPLPPDKVAKMPTVHRPVRCRGAEETPLPPEFHNMDLWNLRSKAELAPSEGPHVQDAGAVRSSQVAIHRLLAGREFATTQKAAVRKSMQLAKGITPFDEPDAPYYGSDIAEDESPMDIHSEFGGSGLGSPRRRVRVMTPRQSSSVKVRPGIATQTADDLGQPTPEEVAWQAQRDRAVVEMADIRKQLLSNNLNYGRAQVLENAFKAAEAALETLKPRPIGSGISTPREPDNPRLLFMAEEPRDVTTAYRPKPLEHSHPEVLPNQWYKRSDSMTSQNRSGRGDRGPEPFGLERLWREEEGSDSESAVDAIPSTDLPTPKSGIFNDRSMAGFTALADYEVSLARRRAIAGAEVMHLRTDFIPKEEVFNLFVVYCNLDRQPEYIQLLQGAIEAPVSQLAISAATRAATANAAAAGPAAAAAAIAASTATRTYAGRQAEVEEEATRQRTKGTAWLLGVIWRRISIETYTSFLSRVLGWPTEVTAIITRTRACQMIARALVHGHDMRAVLRPPPKS